MTTVSIALATYNGSKYLDEQLQTLARQERLPDELVVTDDASADDTVAKVEAFAASARFPVRLHRNTERLGYRANFMRVAALCRSDVIAFCDQDDIWEPQKLRVCLARFDDPEVLLLYHDALAVTPDATPLAPLEHPSALPIMGFLQSPPMDYALGFTQLLRRSLIDLSELWPQSLDHKEMHRRERMAHDQWFFFLGSALGSIAHIDERLVRYRQHENNAYGWRAPSRLAMTVQRLWPSLHGRAEQYAALEMGAERRAAILGQLAVTSAAGGWRSRASAGMEKYRALAHLYGERRRIYGSTNLGDRAAAFGRLLTNHGYRQNRDWGLGARALLTDFCLGLPAGYRLAATRARLTPHRSGV
jgi:glycosyltransferase involved in cell wall biosynthesis